MRIIDKDIEATCEWCEREEKQCSVLLYGEAAATLICGTCLKSLHDFLETIGVKEAEI